TSRARTMTSLEANAKAVITELEACCRKLCEIAATARRNRKSLSGSDRYAGRFRKTTATLMQVETKLKPLLAAGDRWGELSGLLEAVKSPITANKQRTMAVQQIAMVCRGSILPAIEATAAPCRRAAGHIIPMELFRGTCGYIENLAVQVN